MKAKLFYIRENIFRSSINFFINFTFENLNKELKKGGAKPLDDGYKTFNGLSFADEHDERMFFYIWVPKLEWSLSGQAILAHEISHSIFSIMAYKGIEIWTAEESANETFCYLLEYYFYNACGDIGKFYEKKENRR